MLKAARQASLRVQEYCTNIVITFIHAHFNAQKNAFTKSAVHKCEELLRLLIKVIGLLL